MMLPRSSTPFENLRKLTRWLADFLFQFGVYCLGKFALTDLGGVFVLGSNGFSASISHSPGAPSTGYFSALFARLRKISLRDLSVSQNTRLKYAVRIIKSLVFTILFLMHYKKYRIMDIVMLYSLSEVIDSDLQNTAMDKLARLRDEKIIKVITGELQRLGNFSP